jgi:hypothetical protein
MNQASGQPHDQRFAGAGFAEQYFCFARSDVKRDALENLAFLEMSGSPGTVSVCCGGRKALAGVREGSSGGTSRVIVGL